MSQAKKNIKIAFSDFFPTFTENSNIFIRILQQKYDVTISDKPDFLIYSCYSSNHKNYKDCVKIFYTNEAITPNFNECDYAIGFDFIDFSDRFIRNTKRVPYTPEKKQNLPESMTKRKFCNFIYSNANSGDGAILRQEFCKKLIEYKHVDCPGKILNNMKDAIEPRNGDWAKGKLDFISKYKFTIAFENCSMDGYTTEKLTQPLQADSIPIYWGNPKVVKDFNPKAFINCNDFNKLNEVVEYVKYLDTNDDAYMEMLRQPPMQENFKDANLKAFLYNIVEKGNKPYGKNPRKIRTASIENVAIQEIFESKYKASFFRSMSNILTFPLLRRKAWILLKENNLNEVEELAYNLMLNNPYLGLGHNLLKEVDYKRNQQKVQEILKTKQT